MLKTSTENALSADNQQVRVPKNKDHLGYYLSGFADGEGCFCVPIRKHPTSRSRWIISPLFEVFQDKGNPEVVYLFKEVLGCGFISYKSGSPNCLVYMVASLQNHLEKVIPFFESYPIIGKKHQEFLRFKEVVEMLSRKEHKTTAGFKRIVEIAFSMNQRGKGRKHSKEEIFITLDQTSETTRRTPIKSEMI
ncbi:MAG: Homing endonuclease LAGLIDADG/HNH [Microgenomates group bacterium Gr01-1014_5]|nr:MAG: Homing endonuclease LAGLIDADG/HNH [Microgenomates group bacterium Gr01-1014_5]